MRRRLIAIALASPAFVSLPVLAAEPAFPSKPITIIVGNAPGGSNDTFARAIAKRLQDAMGQTVVIENKPASQGIIGSTFVARAPADGYTLMVVSSTFTTAAAIQ
ncbi:MAG: tripartite tricarboxylate transporter substrate-binding protein, partial [Rubrivivax sp.]|nr:tripartite tricarboxylate transporter substrate-binding protein [Rubrivivax sp.]